MDSRNDFLTPLRASICPVSLFCHRALSGFSSSVPLSLAVFTIHLLHVLDLRITRFPCSLIGLAKIFPVDFDLIETADGLFSRWIRNAAQSLCHGNETAS